jgi:uncharacterized protein YdaU (DUF1376 family)
MSRLPWYKRYPADAISGAVGLTFEEVGFYFLTLDHIYERGGGITDSPEFGASLMRCDKRQWRRLRDSLVAKGKLVASGGILHNPRARLELVEQAEWREQLAEAGKKGGKTRAQREAEARSPDLFGKAFPPDFSRTSGELPPNFSGTSGRSSGDAPGNTPKKGSKINGTAQARLNHARAKADAELEKIPPLSAPPAKSRNKSASATKMPKGWEPAPLAEGTAEIASAWPQGMLAREFETFRDWCAANGTTSKDWDARWRNWIRKADNDWKQRGARAGGKRSGWDFSNRPIGSG